MWSVVPGVRELRSVARAAPRYAEPRRSTPTAPGIGGLRTIAKRSTHDRHTTGSVPPDALAKENSLTATASRDPPPGLYRHCDVMDRASW